MARLEIAVSLHARRQVTDHLLLAACLKDAERPQFVSLLEVQGKSSPKESRLVARRKLSDLWMLVVVGVANRNFYHAQLEGAPSRGEGVRSTLLQSMLKCQAA